MGILFFLSLVPEARAYSQTSDTAITEKKFFSDDKIITITLVSDFKTLRRKRKFDTYYPASITMQMPDSSVIADSIEIKPRGQLRKEMCHTPPLMFNFKPAHSPHLKKLGTLKLVAGCDNGKMYEQLLLKEYVAYKLYNLLSEMSFRVRLVKIKFIEEDGKKEPDWQYAFFIEDVDDLAKRNNCRETERQFSTESTNREQMTLVALFEYMIGNTDFTVFLNRNTKVIRSRTDSTAPPYVIPYDFDYAGLVDAPYAVPNELYSDKITHVTERMYKGYVRTMDELEATFKIFRSQRENMNALITSLEPLEDYSKKKMIKYLDSFFDIINDPKAASTYFIDEALRARN